MGLENNDGFVVAEQAVHGYSDGHRMLAASTKFPREIERQIRMLSDLSGPRLVEGFEEYWTAYPLSDGELFAVAKTWYASEVRRPGSVWTQTLVFEQSELRNLRSISALIGAFSRPSKDALPQYDRQIRIPRTGAFPPIDDSPVLDSLAQAYYSSTHPVLISCNSASQIGMEVFQLWQFNALYADNLFSFCTGAIRLRRNGNEILDLQVTDSEGSREARRSKVSVSLIDVEELVSSCASGGLEFVKQHAESRSVVHISRLFEINALIQSTKSENELPPLIAAVAETWPTPHAGDEFKFSAFGPQASRRYLKQLEDIAIIAGILSNENAQAFDYEHLKFQERLRLAAHETPVAIADFVAGVARPFDEREAELLVPALELVSAEVGLTALARLPTNVVSHLARNNFDYLLHPITWEILGEEQVAKIVETNEWDSVAIKQIIEFAISRKYFSVLQTIPTKYSGELSDALLTLLDRDGHLDDRLWEVLQKRENALARSIYDMHFRASSKQLGRLLQVFDPASETPSLCGAEFWKSGFDESGASSAIASELSVFLTVHIFSNPQTTLIALLPEAYKAVYKAADSQSLHVTEELDNSLPNGFLWSIQKRLQVGLVQFCSNVSSPPELFLESIPADRFVVDVLSIWGWSKSEVKFLGRMIEFAMQASNELVPRSRKELFQQYAKYFLKRDV